LGLAKYGTRCNWVRVPLPKLTQKPSSVQSPQTFCGPGNGLLHNHRSYHSLSASTMSTSTASTSIMPTITPAQYANNLRMLFQTKPSRLLHGPRCSLPRPQRAWGYRRCLHPPSRDAVVYIFASPFFAILRSFINTCPESAASSTTQSGA
jgi:hypothetical protein